MREQTMYHKILRVSAVVCAFALVFVSGLLSDTTRQLSQNTQNYLANAIGMSASVQPTELNKYTAELTQKERELATREASLREREIAVNLSNGTPRNSDTFTYILASILFVLLVLILLNYTLDYLRSKEEERALPV